MGLADAAAANEEGSGGEGAALAANEEGSDGEGAAATENAKASQDEGGADDSEDEGLAGDSPGSSEVDDPDAVDESESSESSSPSLIAIEGIAIALSDPGPFLVGQEGVTADLSAAYDDGTSAPYDGDVAWESADESVLMVDAGGALTFIAAGKAKLTAEIDLDPGTASCTISVEVYEEEGGDEQPGDEQPGIDHYYIVFSDEDAEEPYDQFREYDVEYHEDDKGVTASVYVEYADGAWEEYEGDVEWSSGYANGVLEVSGQGLLTFAYVEEDPVALLEARLGSDVDDQSYPTATFEVSPAKGASSKTGKPKKKQDSEEAPAGDVGNAGSNGLDGDGDAGLRAGGTDSEPAGPAAPAEVKAEDKKPAKSQVKAEEAALEPSSSRVHAISFASSQAAPLSRYTSRMGSAAGPKGGGNQTLYMIGAAGVILLDLALTIALILGIRRAHPTGARVGDER